MESLESRIQRLETALNLLEGKRELELRKLLLTDANGLCRMEVCVRPENDALELTILDANSAPRFSAVVNSQAASLFLKDGEGIARIRLEVDIEGTTSILMQDSNMHTRVEICIDEDGGPVMATYGPEHRPLWSSVG